MAYWVFLADPEDFGWTELEAQGEAVWDGIKNARRCRQECFILREFPRGREFLYI